MRDPVAKTRRYLRAAVWSSLVLALVCSVAAAGRDRAQESGEKRADDASWRELLDSDIPYREVVRFHWKLEGFSGGLLRLFPIVSTHGTGLLESRSLAGEHLDYRFRASFADSPEQDFWEFRSVIDLRQGKTVHVRDVRRFRGREKVIEADLREERAMDIIAGLHWLREIHPKSNQQVRAWADEKFYPVEVVAHGLLPYELEDRTVPAEHYTIQGIKQKGTRYWKPRADIWLRVEAERMPIEIFYVKGMVRVRLRRAADAEDGGI